MTHYERAVKLIDELIVLYVPKEHWNAEDSSVMRDALYEIARARSLNERFPTTMSLARIVEKLPLI